MTTIVYNHKDKEIAFDSRMTEGGVIVTDLDTKHAVIGNNTFIACGGVSDGDELIQVYLGNKTAKSDLDANIIVINNKGVFCASYIDSLLNIWAIKHNTAWGSGEKFALAAMDFGKSAKEAVKYAMTRDIYTGGKINLIKVT